MALAPAGNVGQQRIEIGNHSLRRKPKHGFPSCITHGARQPRVAADAHRRGHESRFVVERQRGAVDTIAQVFEQPETAGTTAREKAIVQFSIKITEQPAALDAGDIDALQAEGLNEGEILDLLHSDAIFAWANRLKLNLGEPLLPA